MARFLVDEDLPRPLAPALRSAGHDAADVRDVALRGRSDDDVFAFAQRERRIVLTADVAFANEADRPLGTHSGLVLVRYPNDFPAPDLVAAILASLLLIDESELVGSIAVLEPGRIRLRRRETAP